MEHRALFRQRGAQPRGRSRGPKRQPARDAALQRRVRDPGPSGLDAAGGLGALAVYQQHGVPRRAERLRRRLRLHGGQQPVAGLADNTESGLRLHRRRRLSAGLHGAYDDCCGRWTRGRSGCHYAGHPLLLHLHQQRLAGAPRLLHRPGTGRTHPQDQALPERLADHELLSALRQRQPQPCGRGPQARPLGTMAVHGADGVSRPDQQAHRQRRLHGRHQPQRWLAGAPGAP